MIVDYMDISALKRGEEGGLKTRRSTTRNSKMIFWDTKKKKRSLYILGGKNYERGKHGGCVSEVFAL